MKFWPNLLLTRPMSEYTNKKSLCFQTWWILRAHLSQNLEIKILSFKSAEIIVEDFIWVLQGKKYVFFCFHLTYWTYSTKKAPIFLNVNNMYVLQLNFPKNLTWKSLSFQAHLPPHLLFFSPMTRPVIKAHYVCQKHDFTTEDGETLHKRCHWNF